MRTNSKELKEYNAEQYPELHTERYILVKIEGNEHEIRNLLVRKGIPFEDLVIHSILNT
ncbi:MAG TPA: hypothetical protein VKM55_10010 [Candidatus Lokiarchaeia archaeon]|nr:hypothetical protein [Candidatus Lokiarchaeia archaeon]